MLHIDHLTKRYGDKLAVDDLSLHIRPGELCGFIGHNGAGKTTTLRCCAGILPFTQGEIQVDGLSLRREPVACKQRMAYIPDNPDLYDFLSGSQYLGFIADIYAVPAALRRQRTEEYAQQLNLTEAELAQPISSYSHGMKQKLALISAFVHQPRLILLDEPFVGLDPLASHTLKQLMRQHCAGGGAILFSTHVLEVAEKLCDRVAIIRQGRLLVSGSMEQVRGNASLEDVFLELEERHA